jgi:hypothetical protein
LRTWQRDYLDVSVVLEATYNPGAELADDLLLGALREMLLVLSEDGPPDDLFIGDRHGDERRVVEID